MPAYIGQDMNDLKPGTLIVGKLRSGHHAPFYIEFVLSTKPWKETPWEERSTVMDYEYLGFDSWQPDRVYIRSDDFMKTDLDYRYLEIYD